MPQRTSLTIPISPDEAERYSQAIHEALRLMNDLPPVTTGAYEQVTVRADLMRLAALLEDAVPLLGFEPAPDPFLLEGDGSAGDVLLGRLYDSQRQVLTYLQGCTVSPRQKEQWDVARRRLELAWREYEEAGRG